MPEEGPHNIKVRVQLLCCLYECESTPSWTSPLLLAVPSSIVRNSNLAAIMLKPVKADTWHFELGIFFERDENLRGSKQVQSLLNCANLNSGKCCLLLPAGQDSQLE
jgi:hypothetical protein